MYDPGAQDGKELRQPGGVRRPGRRGHQVAVGVGLVDRDVGVLAAGKAHFRRTGRVGRAGPAFQHAGCGQQLSAVADCGDRLVGAGEVTHDLQHAFVQAQVFRSPPARDDQAVVGRRIDIGKARVEREVMPAFLGIGLVAFEVMDGGGAAGAGGLVRAYRVDRVAHHLEGLERHHGFVVFGIVADQHQDLFGHRGLLYGYGCQAGTPRRSRCGPPEPGPLCCRSRQPGW